MPEAPEVRTSRDQLQVLVGKQVDSSSSLPTGRYALREPGGGAQFNELLKSRTLTIASVESHGKFMHWRFDDASNASAAWLHCSHGMSGQWTWNHEADHLAFALKFFESGRLFDESFVFFRDQRRFGTLKFIFDVDEHQKKLGSLAPCVFDRNFSFDEFARRTKKHASKLIGEVLMDQRALVAGVGNYLRAEILYAARINPFRSLESLSEIELSHVWSSMLHVTRTAYEAKGATFRTHLNVDGSMGAYTDDMKVYGRRFDPLGNGVVRACDAKNRTLWWVPKVQR